MRYKALFMAAAFLSVNACPGFGMPASVRIQQPGADDATEPPPLAIPPGYRYDPAGRRDPFVNPIPPPAVDAAEAGPIIPAVRPQGLPGVLLNEAIMLGVVSSAQADMNVVLIQAPGNRRFIARPGDEMLDVIIRDIRSGSVVFEVKPLEGSSEPRQPQQVVRPVGAAPGE